MGPPKGPAHEHSQRVYKFVFWRVEGGGRVGGEIGGNPLGLLPLLGERSNKKEKKFVKG